MRKSYLYKIVNNINGKTYIGMTSNPKERERQHLDESWGSNYSPVREDVMRHGRENFLFQTLCMGNREYIADLEIKAIEAYDAIENGYNSRRGGGRVLSQREKDKQRSEWNPEYVAGFWFPNPRTAKDALKIPNAYYDKWKAEGTLGDVRKVRKDSLEKPVYVGGFWFDTITTASSKLRLKRETIWARVNRGTVEQELRSTQQGKKADGTYSMTGRTGSKHHRSKAVIVHGVEYGSLAEAGRESGYTRKVISSRIKNNVPGFEWA